MIFHRIALALATGLLLSQSATAQNEIQMSVLSGTNAYNVFAPGQSFQFNLRPNIVSGSAPGDLAYQWIDFQGNTLSSPQSLAAGQSNTISSPFASMDVGYYGLQFLGSNTSFNPQTNKRNELGFSVLPTNTDRAIDSSSFFGMVQHDYNDPYVNPGYIKTRTNVHAYNSGTGVVDAGSWQSQIGTRYSQGQLEIPLVNATPWPSSDNSPIPQSQLNDLQSMFQQYMTADDRVPAWELGIEEQLSSHGAYYWQNLREKFKTFNAARDTVFPGGGGPQLGYQVVNYSSSWINQLFSSPSTDPGSQPAGDEIDFLAIHPYDWAGFRDAEQWHDARFNTMKSQLTGFGKQNLPIWYTEGGAPINDAEVPQLFSGSTPITGRSRADHPRFMVKLHMEALDAGVEHFTWYNYQDNFANDTDVEAHFGMVDHWQFPKPSYTAYANMVNSFKGKNFDGSEVLASGVTVYRFSDGTEQSLVAWSPEGTSNSTDFTALFGGTVPSQFAGSNIVGTPFGVAGQSVNIGEEPLYFTTATSGGGPGTDAFQINLDLQGHTTSDANNPSSSDWIDPAADGVPSLQDITHQWNYHNDTFAGSTSALDDVEGNATGVSFKLINAVSAGVKNNTQLGGTAPFDDVARDHVHIPNGGDVEWELSGLATDGTTYDLYVLAANLWNGGWTDLLVTDASGTELKQLINTNAGGTQYTGGPLVEGDQFEEFLGLLPDANGVISGVVRDYNDGAGEKYFSGLQLISHPVAIESADFDGDGDVDGADFLAWQRGNGTDYDASHLALWQSQYGASASAATSSSAVPEPATSVMLAIAAAMGVFRRRQQLPLDLIG